MKEPSTIIEFIKLLKEHKIPATEYKKYCDIFLDIKTRERKIPLYGKFELTPLCNLDCKMCYVHLDNKMYDNNKLLSIDTWKSLILQASELGMLKASLTGGECLTYHGFDEIYLFLRGLGISTTVMSNGLLINRNRIDFFKQFPPNHIIISIYGSSNDAYEAVTGHRVFDTVINNILLMRSENLPIILTITPNKYMEKDIRPLLELVESLDIPYNVNSNLISPRKDTGRKKADLSLEQYIEIYKIIKEIKNEILVPVDPSELPSEGVSGSVKRGLTCGGGKNSFVIKYNGFMSPCPSLSEISANAVDLGFLKAWETINALAGNYLLPVECNDCVYKSYCLTCVAVHKDAPRKGHCDRRICERTKRLVQEGFIKISE